MVEEKFKPNFGILNSLDQMCRRRRYEDTIIALKKEKGIKPKRIKLLETDITDRKNYGFES